jgi:cytoskeletal protein RodZ
VAIFNRQSNKSKPQVPKAVEDYYQAEQRDRRGLAWLLAFVTLVVTVLVFSGLFFGGRAVYRSITKDNKQPKTASTTKQKPANSSSNSSSSPSQSQPSPNSSTSPTPNPNPTPQTQPTPSTVPNTGPGNLPNTGPDADL